MPKRGPDQEKINKILNILEKAGKEGVWIRELARQSKLPFSTVYYYINNYLQDEVLVTDMKLGLAKSSKFKIVRLRKFG